MSLLHSHLLDNPYSGAKYSNGGFKTGQSVPSHSLNGNLSASFGSLLFVTNSSKPASFHAPFEFMIMLSGHIFRWRSLTSLCKNDKASASCMRPYFISTSNSLYSANSWGNGEGIFSWLPNALATLQKQGSVANAKLSLLYF